MKIMNMHTIRTNCLPPVGPSLSFERFSIAPSTIPCSVLDFVVAEKLIVKLLFALGKPESRLATWTVLPTPVPPTTIKLRFEDTTVLNMYEFRTVSVVGTIILKNGSPFRGRQVVSVLSHNSKSPFL